MDKIPELPEWVDEQYREIYGRMLVAKDTPEIRQLAALKDAAYLKSEFVSEVRELCQRDLYFLAKYVLASEEMNLINLVTHKPVCDFFVRKDPTRSIAAQDTFKERLLLYPRGSMKSTLDIADAVQWILCFPDIRILFLTSAQALAIGFVDLLKHYFIINPNDPTMMNIFWPDFSIPETKEALGKADEFMCPMRRVQRAEPTVKATSIDSVTAGFHAEVIKADDVVANNNTGSEEQLAKTTKKVRLARKLLLLYGYMDYIGTRYDDGDMYGEMLERNIGEITTYSDHPCRQFIDNKTTGLKVLIGRAVVLKPELSAKSYIESKEEGCDYIFPEYLSYSFFMKEYNQDEFSAESQYNQNPRTREHATFDRDLLIAHTIPFQDIPFNGPTVITWDLAYGVKKGRDYSTAAVGLYDTKGRLFIVDIVRRRFTPTELAQAVVDLAEKWLPEVIGIEESVGVRYIEDSIIRAAMKTGNPHVINLCSHIDYIPTGNEKDAKTSRMKSMHPWLKNDMLFFSSALPDLETLYKEFEGCLRKHHYDDIPDVISRQLPYGPRIYQSLSQEINIGERAENRRLYGDNPIKDTPEGRKQRAEDAQYNILYGQWLDESGRGADAWGRLGMGDPQPIVQPVPEEEQPKAPSIGGMPGILGSGMFG